jgi:two-component system, OmpR family, sensor kinase
VRALNRLSLRLKLTLAFAGAAFVLLAGIGAFIVWRVQTGLDAEIDHTLRLRAYELAERAADPKKVDAIIDAAGQPAQVLDRNGRVLASVRVPGAHPLVRTHLAAARRGEVIYESKERTRLLARPAAGGRIVAVAASMRARESTLESLRGVLLIGLPIALLLASLAGYAVAAGALRPVERMRSRAERISAATIDARLPLPTAQDELRRLGETLNAMLARLAAAAENEREFLSTASHELRTPLAILKAEIEFALHPESTPEDWHSALVSAGEETDRLVRLAEDLLLLARGEHGAAEREVPEVALAPLAARVAARFGEEGVELAIPEDVRVRADPDGLDRALTNLIDNARRYGAVPILVSARADGEWVELHVADHGAGFAPEYLPRAFERFSRPAGARGGGAGLGLALVEAVAHAHGGSAGAANAEPAGADVWLRLPRA